MARIEPLGIHEVDDEIRHPCEEAERQSGTSASTRTAMSGRDPGCVRSVFEGFWFEEFPGIDAMWQRWTVAHSIS
jgi:hypothetical protein